MTKRIGANVRLTRYLREDELGELINVVEDVWRTIRGDRDRVAKAGQLK